MDEGGSSKPPSNDEVAIPPTIEGDTTPPTGSDGDTSQTPPESGGDQQPSEPTVTNQSQVQIVKSTGSSELVGAGESYTPYGTIELSLKLSGKILESKIDIPVTPEQPDDGTGEGDIDDGEDENKPSEGGTDDGSGDSSGEDSDKPSNGDGEQKPPTEDGGNKPDEGEGIPDNGVNGTPDVLVKKKNQKLMEEVQINPVMMKVIWKDHQAYHHHKNHRVNQQNLQQTLRIVTLQMM